MDNYIKAAVSRVMWWPINQQCVGCKHKQSLTLTDLQTLGMFKDIVIDENHNDNSNPEDEPLLYHASRCKVHNVLGRLGSGSYECSEYKMITLLETFQPEQQARILEYVLKACPSLQTLSSEDQRTTINFLMDYGYELAQQDQAVAQGMQSR